jgi:hypothetical protein
MVFMFNAFATQEINPSLLLLAGSTTVTMLMAAQPGRSNICRTPCRRLDTKTIIK